MAEQELEQGQGQEKQQIVSDFAALTEALRKLEPEVRRVADAAQPRKESLWKRFIAGLIFGLGTALGATVVATIVIFVAGRILDYLGIIDGFQMQALRDAVENRVRN